MTHVSVRIFAMPEQSRIAIPRRGAVKVWTVRTERHLAEQLSVPLRRSGLRDGLAEFTLHLAESGSVTDLKVIRSIGSSETDAACLDELSAGLPWLSPPPQMLGAEVVMLVELGPAPQGDDMAISEG